MEKIKKQIEKIDLKIATCQRTIAENQRKVEQFENEKSEILNRFILAGSKNNDVDLNKIIEAIDEVFRKNEFKEEEVSSNF